MKEAVHNSLLAFAALASATASCSASETRSPIVEADDFVLVEEVQELTLNEIWSTYHSGDLQTEDYAELRFWNLSPEFSKRESGLRTVGFVLVGSDHFGTKLQGWRLRSDKELRIGKVSRAEVDGSGVFTMEVLQNDCNYACTYSIMTISPSDMKLTKTNFPPTEEK